MKKQLTAIAAATGLALTGLAGTADAKGKPGDLNIVQAAVAANAELGVFDTVLAAAQCEYFDGAIVAALTGDDKVTLFAPIDDAFAVLGLDESNICDSFAESPGALANILTYHVTDGRRFSNSVFNKNNSKSLEMLNGGTVVSNPDLTLSDEATDRAIGIVAPYFDINASNGVIHTIDSVLLPAG